LKENYIFIFGSSIIALIGLFGILSTRNIFKIILNAGILETGVNLFLISIGYFSNSFAPIVNKVFNINSIVDPLPQALVLTSIVIGFGTMSLALVIVLDYYKKTKSLELIEIKENGEEE